MGIALTSDQITALAPDANSVVAGKKLSSPKTWRNLGLNDQALWGECQGSALYQVAIDLTALTAKCTCPSHKFPCKHALGLMLLTASMPGALDGATPPEWVATWLAKRAATAAKQDAPKPAAEQPRAPSAKTAAKRAEQVTQGIIMLDRWLDDLIRNGLASADTQPPAFWREQAARLVDAKAPGIAARLRHMAEIPGATADWPERLLAELGKLALLTHAYRRIDQLEPLLQEDIRQLIGWTVKQEEVAARGTVIADDWHFLGQRIEDGERPDTRVQRTWALGAMTGHTALLLDFSAQGAPFAQLIPPGTHQQAELAFWPGATEVRARFMQRHGDPLAIQGRLPGAANIAAYLAQVAAWLARQPWQDRFLCVLRDVTPTIEANKRWHIHDQANATLPLTVGEHWQLLALSGGIPVDLAGEWDGDSLLPFGVAVAGAYHLLGGL